MKPAALLWLAGAVAVASSVATTFVMRTSGGAHAAAKSEGLETRLDALASRVAALESRTPRGETDPALRAAPVPTISRGEVERIVAAEVEKRRAREVEGPAPTAIDVQAVVTLLLDADVADARKRAIWKKVRQQGHVDAMVAAFERRAADAPRDADRKHELALAYFQRMLASPDGPERGHWGKRGADTLVAALVLGPAHWDARFALAQHYYWAGMGADAVRELETLLRKQNRRAPEPKHAQTYLWLGNLYLERGERRETALHTWSVGLRRSPDDEALKARIAAHR